MPTATDAELVDLLTAGTLTPVGRLVNSSNGALLCSVQGPDCDAEPLLAIHKPESSERPLWDYPDGTLVARERAAYLVSTAGGFGVVPPTVLREGPFGPGSVQLWVGPLEGEREVLVDVTAAEAVPPGWLVVLEGETPEGEPVVVSHSPEPALRTVAVLDAVLNNSDRKGGHLFVVDDHLRGWAGDEILDADLARLDALGQALAGSLATDLAALLTVVEVAALRDRVSTLLATRRHPLPTPGWPAIPWPAL